MSTERRCVEGLRFVDAKNNIWECEGKSVCPGGTSYGTVDFITVPKREVEDLIVLLKEIKSLPENTIKVDDKTLAVTLHDLQFCLKGKRETIRPDRVSRETLKRFRLA